MTAKKLKQEPIDVLARLESRLGRLGLSEELWLPQVEKLSSLGLVDPDILNHIAINLQLYYQSENKKFYRFVKRCSDIIFCLLFSLLLVPVFLIVALALKIDSRGPVFFFQVRIGHLGKPFKIIKFRTMHENSATTIGKFHSDNFGPFFKLHQDPRITRVGKFLRRWSLDELPQIFNVITGDMTLVGPRPLPVYDVAGIPLELIDRFSVKPGLTGLWQVLARDSSDGIKNLMIDKEYANNFGLVMDVKILLKTPGVVISGVGAR